MEYLLEFEFAKKSLFDAAKRIVTSKSVKMISSDGKDIKLSLDKELDDYLSNELSNNFKHSILSEENGLSKPLEAHKPYWILDPIDGSMNLSRGIPISAISLAFWQEDQPIFGLIYDYNQNEFLSGYVDHGAWMNDVPLLPAKTRNTAQSIIATGIPKDMNLSESSKKEFLDEIIKFKKVRMFGSAAISMLHVAMGRVDAYMEKDIKLWDVAAGLSILMALNKKPSQFIIKENDCVDIKIAN